MPAVDLSTLQNLLEVIGFAFRVGIPPPEFQIEPL